MTERDIVRDEWCQRHCVLSGPLYCCPDWRMVLLPHVTLRSSCCFCSCRHSTLNEFCTDRTCEVMAAGDKVGGWHR